MAEKECTICGNITEWECEQCGEPTCEDCLTQFTIQNQIDYCLCSCCHSGNNRAKAEYYQRLDDEEKERIRIKKEKSYKRWVWYHSLAQIEKRRLKRIELLKQRKEQQEKRVEFLADVLKDLFKHM